MSRKAKTVPSPECNIIGCCITCAAHGIGQKSRSSSSGHWTFPMAFVHNFLRLMLRLFVGALVVYSFDSTFLEGPGFFFHLMLARFHIRVSLQYRRLTSVQASY